MTNTEKPTTMQEAKKRGVNTEKNVPQVNTPKQKVEVKKEDSKKDVSKKETEANVEDKKEVKKPVVKKVKKTEVTAKGVSFPVSTKYAVAICRFIKGKNIVSAIADLNDVLSFKKAVPMRGEIPHRKGKGISSGRYPQKAAMYFVKLLNSLKSNAENHDLNEPVIVEAVANVASRPYSKFGRVRRKRTHILLRAKSVKQKELNKDEGNK